jgi:hypothetical protein
MGKLCETLLTSCKVLTPDMQALDPETFIVWSQPLMPLQQTVRDAFLSKVNVTGKK